jgi:toxin-antitoxin system PIN domain toxin
MPDAIYLPDVNVLFAAHVAVHVHHDLALSWLRAVERFATCATTEQGLVRLLANPVTNPGASIHDALAALARVRARGAHVWWPETASLDAPVIDTTKMSGHRQVTDFHLVNLAASYGGRLVTLDTRIEPALSTHDRARVLTLNR